MLHALSKSTAITTQRQLPYRSSNPNLVQKSYSWQNEDRQESMSLASIASPHCVSPSDPSRAKAWCSYTEPLCCANNRGPLSCPRLSASIDTPPQCCLLFWLIRNTASSIRNRQECMNMYNQKSSWQQNSPFRKLEIKMRLKFIPFITSVHHRITKV